MPNPASTANFFGYPMHPMLLPSPIAFLDASLVCDLAFWQTGRLCRSALSRKQLVPGTVRFRTVRPNLVLRDEHRAATLGCAVLEGETVHIPTCNPSRTKFQREVRALSRHKLRGSTCVPRRT